MDNDLFTTRRAHQPTVGIVADIIKDPEQIEWIDPEFKPLLDLPDIRGHVESDMIPIPAPEDREGYYDERHFAYWMSGYTDCKRLITAIPDVEGAERVLDFGGASGRVARHLIGGLGKVKNVVLAELNINHVSFIAEHFPRSVIPFKLSDLPYLMLEDNSCDVVCAYSVFTHIDTYEFSWLAELKRVLRPGGRALITLHTEHTWDLLPNIFVYPPLSKNSMFTDMFREGEPMPEGRYVFRGSPGPDNPNYDCNMFHHTSYIQRQWSRFMTVEQILPDYSVGYQTAVVLRND